VGVFFQMSRPESQPAGRPAGLSVLIAGMFCVVAASLSGCNFAGSDGATSASGVAARKPSAADSDMVAAVSTSRSAGVVELKFAVAKRPKVGEPVEVEFSITPSIPLEGLFARFQVVEGLQLVSGGETEHLENAPGGVSVGHKVTVLPQADGIFYITAVVLADSETESVARTFTIPLIAGQGFVESPATPQAASVAEPQRAPERE
jgi:hypothetical protein